MIVNTYYGEEKQTAQERREAQQARDRKLFLAARSGQLHRVQYLLRKEADVDHMEMEGEGYGSTALHVAALNGHTSVVEALIFAGADVHHTLVTSASTHLTTVDFASAAGFEKVVSALVLAGAKLSPGDEASPDKERAELAKRPQSSKRIVNATGPEQASSGNEPRPSLASCREQPKSNSTKRPATWREPRKGLVVRFVLEEEGGATKDTQLWLAAREGDFERVRLLLTEGANVNFAYPQTHNRLEEGTSSLHKAAQGGHRVVAETLISSGADTNQITAHGETPLICASKRGHQGVVDTLLRLGAQIDKAERGSDTALYCACAGRSYSHVGVIKSLLRGGADIDYQTRDGLTPLHAAALSDGTGSAVEALLSAGADPNICGSNHQTALDVAETLDGVRSISPAVIEVLKQRGAEKCRHWPRKRIY